MTLRLGLAAILFFAAASAAADPVPRVGVVDVQAVLTKSTKGITAKQILDKEKDGYQAEMDLRRRELEILRYLPSRMKTVEIAQTVYVSRNTLKTHLRNIYRKLDVTNRDEAAAAAERLGLA